MGESNNALLIVTGTPNPEQQEAFQRYTGGVTPLLLELGGKPIQRAQITETYLGQASFAVVLVMEFPSRTTLRDFFNSETYQAFIPDKEKAFLNLNIFFGNTF